MKLVRESVYNFHKTGDAKSGLVIGLRNLIEEWIEKMEIKKANIRDNLVIDVMDHVSLAGWGIISFPEYIQFGKISGYFDISHNNLESLRGCPRIVFGFFSCAENNLESLSGAPEHVRGSFSCRSNRLKSLDGAPKNVSGFFNCSDNPAKFTEEDVRSISYVSRNVVT